MMGVFDFLRMANTPVQRDANDPRYFGGPTQRSEIGVDVTIDRARQVPVIKDCLQIRSESVASLGFAVFQRQDATTTRRLYSHPIARLFENPNPRETSFEYFAQLVDDLDTYGDHFARMTFGPDPAQPGRTTVIALERLDPASTDVEELEDGTRRFRHNTRRGATEILLEGEVWHIPMPPKKDGLRGRSTILDDGREAVAVAIALQKYANTLFTNDATPPFVFSMPEGQNFKGTEDKRNFLNAWRRWTTGRNRNTPGILEYGISVQKLGITAEEAQFLETRKELWLDLARLWRVPPHKVGIMDNATFSNIEHQAIEFVTDTLRPILELIERSITKHLVDQPGVFFEFNVDSLLRGDIKTRYEAYAVGRQWGWLSVNDVLRLENRNGIGAAGDRYMEPLNMTPVGATATERDAQPGVDQAIAFLRESVARNGGRPRLEIVKDVA